VNDPDRVIKSFKPLDRLSSSNNGFMFSRGVQKMRMPKPVEETKTVAISADAMDEATTKRLVAAMEAFMGADFIEETAVALVQRAA
jgi:hypothetical protein